MEKKFVTSVFKTIIPKSNKTITPLEFILDKLPKCTPDGPWLAGGSLLRTYLGFPFDSDLDYFFKDEDQRQLFINDLVKVLPGNTKMYEKVWHTTFEFEYAGRDWKIQCVKTNFYKDPVELLSTFDIRGCMIAWDGVKITHDVETFKDLDEKVIKLNINDLKYVNVTMSRIIKYSKLGLSIPYEEINGFCAALMGNKNKGEIREDGIESEEDFEFASGY